MPRLNSIIAINAVFITTLAVGARGHAESVISGTVAQATNAKIDIWGPMHKEVSAAADGAYHITALAAGGYTVVPRDANVIFTPVATFKQVNASAISNVNFTGEPTTAPTYTIAGEIGGELSPGAMITLNGANVGSVGTDRNGSYSLSGLAAGVYTVSASQPGHGFTSSRTVTLTSTDSVNNNFTATATPSGESLSLTAVADMPQATVGVEYSSSLLQHVAGGSGTYHYQSGPYSTGTPPRGMVILANGVLTGRPEKAGTYRFELCAADGHGVISMPCASSSITVGTHSVTGPPVAPAPVAPPPTAQSTTGTSWVYYNGVFDWPGDYSFAASPNYGDSSGGPLSGPHDIKVSSSAWGGWLPYARNWNFNSAPYSKLTFALKPTRTDQRWQVYFVKVGDIPVGISVDVSKYGPTPVAGRWGTYTIPLNVLGVAGTSIYKFAIQDKTGANGNTWYVDNVGFEK